MRLVDLPQRMQNKIKVNENGCWVWTGYLYPGGYGGVRRTNEKKTHRTHRYVWELLVGQPPPFLDHLCRNRACCNPDHLESVTFMENINRGISSQVQTKKWANYKVCRNGHQRTEDNLYFWVMPTGYLSKHCRTCRHEAQIRRGIKRRKAHLKA